MRLQTGTSQQEIANERVKLENEARSAQVALESQRCLAQQGLANLQVSNAEQNHLERQLTQTKASAEGQRLQQVLIDQGAEAERIRGSKLATMKADCQKALAEQLRAFQDSLSEKEVVRFVEKEEFRNRNEAEMRKGKLLTSDKENLQRELLQTQELMRETFATTETRFQQM